MEAGDTQYGDYYEKALYNHILASQNPENGMTTYYLPLIAGAKRGYSNAFDTFTCCVGTGFENHARYGEAIYFREKEKRLFVNLYIPSVLKWEEAGMVITQDGSYEQDGKVRFSINPSKPKELPISFRIPYWTTGKTIVKVNGEKIDTPIIPGGTLEIIRKWKKKDFIELDFDMPIYTEPTPDNLNKIAIKYGPLVLAGKLGHKKLEPLRDIPVLIAAHKPVNEWIRRVSKDSLVFRTQGVGELGDITLVPFYTLYNERYMVYFDVFDATTWMHKKQDYQNYIIERNELKERTVDFIQLGEMEPEREHNLKGHSTAVGELLGQKFRLSWNNGWFSFDLKVTNNTPLQLVLTCWSSDGELCSFDVCVDDNILRNITLQSQKNEDFYNMKIDIPLAYTLNKDKIQIIFKSHKDKMVGRIFGVRLIRKN